MVVRPYTLDNKLFLGLLANWKFHVAGLLCVVADGVQLQASSRRAAQETPGQLRVATGSRKL